MPCPLTTGLLMALPTAQAQSGNGSYLAGKTLTIIVNQTAGQPRDLEARPVCGTLEPPSLPQSAQGVNNGGARN